MLHFVEVWSLAEMVVCCIAPLSAVWHTASSTSPGPNHGSSRGRPSCGREDDANLWHYAGGPSPHRLQWRAGVQIAASEASAHGPRTRNARGIPRTGSRVHGGWPLKVTSTASALRLWSWDIPKFEHLELTLTNELPPWYARMACLSPIAAALGRPASSCSSSMPCFRLRG